MAKKKTKRVTGWNSFTKKYRAFCRKHHRKCTPKHISANWKRFKAGKKVLLPKARDTEAEFRAFSMKHTDPMFYNPAMDPATKQKLMIGGGVAVLGWTAWRMHTRSSLVRLLDEDPLIEAARSYYLAGRVPPPGAEWLADPEGNKKRAAEVIPFFGTANALQGYEQIMEEMPPIPTAAVAESPGALDAILQEFERAVGVDLPDVDLPPVDDLLKNIIG